MKTAEEMKSARKTLERSRTVAQMFCVKGAAVAPILLPPLPAAHFGRKPQLVDAILDQKYWFAKLYEIMTYIEIGHASRAEYPGFILHFTTVFYQYYYSALMNFLAGKVMQVRPLWVIHFNGPKGGGAPTDIETVKFSIVTGATAHIQGDMGDALAEAYRTYEAPDKPPFKKFEKDFFSQHAVFEAAKAMFFLDLAEKGPFPLKPELGQMVIGVGEQVMPGGLDIDTVWQWRRDAWAKAERQLTAAAAAATSGGR